jgi:hypothetical protein|tara:strand:+ start:702 stop:1181 length:480 start_codon:yes stop_codon:yes gene_type:complete
MAATSVFTVGSSDITSYQPDILEFGITNFDTQLQFAENDVLRQIREEWWERYRHTVRYKDITKVTTLEMDNSKLTDAQWKRSIIYKALAEYIYPILSKFKDPDGGDGKDAFQNKMDFYRQKYNEEFQAVLRDGVEYDEDSSGTIQASEKEPIHMLRLQR